MNSQSSTESPFLSDQTFNYLQEQLPDSWPLITDESQGLTTLKSKNTNKPYSGDELKNDQPCQKQLKESSTDVNLQDLLNVHHEVQKACQENSSLNWNIIFPTSERIPGKYSFDVIFREAIKDTKHICFTYSERLETLFVRPEICCYAIVSSVGNPPADARIFITPMFLMPHHAKDPVRACPNHMNKKPEESASRHLIRIDLDGVVYGVHPNSEHHYVSVGYHEVSRGKSRFNIPMKFLCYSTCLGGIGRRPFQVIYWLQHEDKILGRKSIKTVVCSSPGRDKKSREMEKSGSRMAESKQKIEKSCLDDKRDNNENSEYEEPKAKLACFSVKTQNIKEYILLMKYRTHLREHSGISCRCTF